MKNAHLGGNWLLDVLLRLKPPKESRQRFLNRCARRLQRQAGIDGNLIRKMLSTGEKVTVPLFAVAVLARELACSVEELLFGTKEPDFDDPALFTGEDRVDLRSASSFATFLEAFHVDFPGLLWEYALPAHRKGCPSEITLDAWIEIHRERYSEDPSPRTLSA